MIARFLFFGAVDHGGQHRRYRFLFIRLYSEGVGGTDSQRFACALYGGTNYKEFASGGSQMIDFKFNAEDGPGSVAAGGIHDTGYRTGVDESVLLRQSGIKTKAKFEVSGRDCGDLGADGAHQALTGEAVSDDFFSRGVHFSSLPRITVRIFSYHGCVRHSSCCEANGIDFGFSG